MLAVRWMRHLQGYLAPEKQRPPRTLQWDHAYGPWGVVGGGALSFERDAPTTLPCSMSSLFVWLNRHRYCPHSGVRPFQHKSTCLTHFSLSPHVVQVFSRNVRESRRTKPSKSTVRQGPYALRRMIGRCIVHKLITLQRVWGLFPESSSEEDLVKLIKREDAKIHQSMCGPSHTVEFEDFVRIL